ncbi:MAG: GAF domain-containing protein [Chloroflexi bacterium]|nr:GAF domain-containing protein [Chloroflexota bacterium]
MSESPAASILVLADTPNDQKYLMEQLLPHAGFRVGGYEDVDQPNTWDVVLMNLMRMRPDSLSVLKQVRARNIMAPAVLYALHIDSDVAAQFFPMRIRRFVPLPVDDQTRLATLTELVHEVRQQADTAALEVRLAQAYALVERRVNEMGTLSRIGRAITAQVDPTTIMKQVLEAGIYLTRSASGLAYTVDPTTGQLVLAAHQGIADAELPTFQVASNDSDAFTVLLSGAPIMRVDQPVKSITVPLPLGNQIIGALSVYRGGAEAFDEADQATLSSVADYAAIALDKMEAVHQAHFRVDQSLQAARKVKYHADTLLDPIDGIEGQVALMTSAHETPLTDPQRNALNRINQAVTPLREIVGLIEDELADFDASG